MWQGIARYRPTRGEPASAALERGSRRARPQAQQTADPGGRDNHSRFQGKIVRQHEEAGDAALDRATTDGIRVAEARFRSDLREHPRRRHAEPPIRGPWKYSAFSR